MLSTSDLTDQVTAYQQQTYGKKEPHEIYNHFILDCKALGLSEQAFYQQVLGPASRRIDWEALAIAEEEVIEAAKRQAEEAEQERTNKIAKDKADKEAALTREETRKRDEKVKQQKEKLHQTVRAEIRNSYSNGFIQGILDNNRLRNIFEKAASIGLNEDEIAAEIRAEIGRKKMKPYPAVEIMAITDKEVLLSTSWYDEWHYKKISAPAPFAAEIPKQPSTPPPVNKPQPQSTPPRPQSSAQPSQKEKSSSFSPLLVVFLLLLVAGGFVAYFAWWKPHIKDRDAPHMYTFAENLWLRSSPIATGLENTLQQLSYGTEVLVYNPMQEWAEVKAGGQQGFVNVNYLLDKKPFYELSSIFADETSRNAVPGTKSRKALLDYYRTHNITGKMEATIQKEIYGNTQQKEVWQLSTKAKNTVPNTILYRKIVDPQSKFSDFAFLLTNQATQKRKFVLYRFQDSEEPVFVYDEEAPDNGDILSITATPYGAKPYRVKYSTY